MKDVRIIYYNQYVIIKFPYDSKLVEIMKSFQAKYYSRGKYWSLPTEKVSDLKEELIFNDYNVIDVGKENYKVIKCNHQ